MPSKTKLEGSGVGTTASAFGLNPLSETKVAATGLPLASNALAPVMAMGSRKPAWLSQSLIPGAGRRNF